MQISRGGVYVVVPAYNEAAAVFGVVDELRRAYPNVVVVDDGSRDDTSAEARRAGAIVLRHVLNRGQGAALQTGIEYGLRRGGIPRWEKKISYFRQNHGVSDQGTGSWYVVPTNGAASSTYGACQRLTQSP